MYETLEEIDAAHIPMVTALNKSDQLNDPERAKETLEHFQKSVAISALTGSGLDDLLHLVREELFESFTPIHIKLPYKEGALISLFHELGYVERVEHGRGSVEMQGKIPGRLLAQFAPWISNGNGTSPELIEETDLEES